jgi:hypothetical protein
LVVLKTSYAAQAAGATAAFVMHMEATPEASEAAIVRVTDVELVEAAPPLIWTEPVGGACGAGWFGCMGVGTMALEGKV